MSFRTSPVPSYLHIDNGTSPTSSRLTIQQSPNPSLPCSSVLHLSGLLDRHNVGSRKNAERSSNPHHTCSLCSLIRRHDQRSLPSSGSQASSRKGTAEKENFSSGASLCLIEEEGLCKCNIPSIGSEDDVSTSPTPKGKPGIAPYFPSSPFEDVTPLPSPKGKPYFPPSPFEDVTPPPSTKGKPGIAPFFPPSPFEEVKEGSSPGSHAAPCQVYLHPLSTFHFNFQQTSTVVDTSDPVENQYLTIKRTLDTLLQKRRSPSAMVRASHAALSFPERLI